MFNTNRIFLNLIHEYIRYRWIKFSIGECETGIELMDIVMSIMHEINGNGKPFNNWSRLVQVLPHSLPSHSTLVLVPSTSHQNSSSTLLPNINVFKPQVHVSVCFTTYNIWLIIFYYYPKYTSSQTSPLSFLWFLFCSCIHLPKTVFRFLDTSSNSIHLLY